MILVFGGTTEGRLTVDVLEQAGKPYWYSTKSRLQTVEMHNGVRLSGGMCAAEIKEFCVEKGVKCIVDAAHPFAENLHKEIAAVGLPVVRLQRNFGSRIDGVIYCKDYTDAIIKLKTTNIKNLLALSGVNTIAKLKDFWTTNNTFFRILNRKESLAVAEKAEFPKDHLIFYNEENSLPAVEEEKQMMQQIGCDAILTKESGESGGFEAKVKAAKELGIQVFVIEHPTLPQHWTYVTGKHGLRRAIEHIVPEFFPLKTGFTTGACATAATKAALLSLLTDDIPEEVSFALPDGEIMTIPVEVTAPGTASVIKDFSDDPDVTKGCRITSHVEFVEGSQGTITFLPGKGVGTVTLPGLGLPVGEPAINPTPRHMITNEFNRLISNYSLPFGGGLGKGAIRIEVENGEELALHTFNPKVGVIGGISIIGTSGIVSPLSNEAFIDSIGRELEVARAIGCTSIGLASGKKGEEALKQEFSDLRIIHYGNFIGETLKQAHNLGFQKVILGIMIGKAVKLAEGNLDTHSHKVQMNKEFLKTIIAPNPTLPPAGEGGCAWEAIEKLNMARELLDFMPPEFFEKIKELCTTHCKTVFPSGELEIRLICENRQ